ncbi:YcaO-like family protein [Desulfomarina sp.]
MMEFTTSPAGKDAPLENTIKRITSILYQSDLLPETTHWLNPAPYCWSVHLYLKNAPFFYTNGKGISRQAALASGLGEFLERLATGFFFDDYYLEGMIKNSPFLHFPDEIWLPSFNRNRQLLTEKLLDFYDPHGDLEEEHLLEHNSAASGKGICCLPFTNLENGNTVNFPVALLHNLYVSNGMAAGNSREECFCQALYEIIERHVKNRVIAEGLALPDIPEHFFAHSPAIMMILEKLRGHGYRVMVKDSSLGGSFPVICVLLFHPESGSAFASFGASLRFDIAIERTLTELLQGRKLDHLSRFQPPVYDLSLTAESYNIESHFINSDGLLSWQMFRDNAEYTFSPWNFSGTTSEELHQIKTIILSSGFPIYYREYNQFNMDVCRIIIPGMSEIYPVDDLVWNNKNKSAALRRLLLQLPQLNEEDLHSVLHQLEENTLGPHQLISDLIGILFEKSNPWHDLCVGELRTYILLALQHHQQAAESCFWCLEYASLSQQRKQLFRAILTLLECRLAGEEHKDYEKCHISFFQKEIYLQAKETIAGNNRFAWLPSATTWREISEKHNNLLTLFERFRDVTRKT